MSRLILDAGAFIAYERGDADTVAFVTAARRRKRDLATSSPVVGQVWRDGRRQAQLARLLAGTRIEVPTEAAARRAGELLAKARMEDVVDALVVGLAIDGDTILTSDPEDLERLVTAARRHVTVISV